MVTIVKPRLYFSARSSVGPNPGRLDLDGVKDLFLAAYQQFRRRGYFDEAFGYCCVDNGEVPGTAGPDIENYVLLQTRKRLWPPTALAIITYQEADLFDLIEFLFDHVSKPLSGYHHTYADCGMHWEKFDQDAGRTEYREVISGLLEAYGKGYEFNERGEIMELAPKGVGKLLKASPPTKDADTRTRMNAAIDRFQRYGSTVEDRRHAVRDLADVLEKLRPEMKSVLTNKDEGDLFNIANNFGIRHFNEKQQTSYDPAVWLSWMFYFYLATINACLHTLARKKTS